VFMGAGCDESIGDHLDQNTVYCIDHKFKRAHEFSPIIHTIGVLGVLWEGLLQHTSETNPITLPSIPTHTPFSSYPPFPAIISAVPHPDFQVSGSFHVITPSAIRRASVATTFQSEVYSEQTARDAINYSVCNITTGRWMALVNDRVVRICGASSLTT
jgi:hypothetical protein